MGRETRANVSQVHAKDTKLPVDLAVDDEPGANIGKATLLVGNHLMVRRED